MEGSGTTWTYDYTAPAGDGTDTFAFSVGTDAAGNTVTAAPTSGATVTEIILHQQFQQLLKL